MNCLKILAVCICALPLATASLAANPSYIDAALKDSRRNEADLKADADRKPAKMLEFAGIKPGTKVVDVVPGGGYFTRIFAAAVGNEGEVYAFVPSEIDDLLQKRFGTTDLRSQYSAYTNIGYIHTSGSKFVTPEPVDVVWISRNYHDFFNKLFGPIDIAAFNKAVFNALKPGGVYIVLDHAAPKGSGVSDTDTLHRIDEDIVKSQVEAAGFKLVGQSDVLRNPNDNRNSKVFEQDIRGHTDQFILKFWKPKK